MAGVPFDLVDGTAVAEIDDELIAIDAAPVDPRLISVKASIISITLVTTAGSNFFGKSQHGQIKVGWNHQDFKVDVVNGIIIYL